MTNADLSLIHYHAPQTRSVAIRWLLAELGVPHELKVLNLKAGEHKLPRYLAINPMGKVPAIAHGGTVVTETAAIAIHLADAYPQAGLAPPIGDPDRGSYLRWIVFYGAAVEPALVDRALRREGGPASMLPYGTVDDAIAALSGALARGPYLLGDRFSAADVVIGSGIRYMLTFKLLPQTDVFTGYASRLAERPALRQSLAEDAALIARLSGKAQSPA